MSRRARNRGDIDALFPKAPSPESDGRWRNCLDNPRNQVWPDIVSPPRGAAEKLILGFHGPPSGLSRLVRRKSKADEVITVHAQYPRRS